MATNKSGSGIPGNSFSKRGKQLLQALRPKSKAHASASGAESSTNASASGAESSTNTDLLGRLPDPSWIDVEMIGYWLEKCNNEHGEKCRRPFGLDPAGLGQAQLLIDVERQCLVSARPGLMYACLSYVWGGASTLKTGTENLNQLREENSLAAHWDEIPKTIRNTIGLVDQLGVKYLWVDCLCIIQDNVESKHDQIQAMSGIYANAYVTIIAGNGWDADHGLRGIQGVTEPRYLSAFLKSKYSEAMQPYSSMWYSRGWTFQEMIFSPRKIMFQYQLALWECNQNTWHESSLSNMSTPLRDLYWTPTVSPWQSRIKISAWPDIEQYMSLVHDYARRKLTYGDDALNAITSLLSVMSTSFSGGFITGLPEMFFDEALLWQPAEPMQRRRCSEGKIAVASWSWASWEGEIMVTDWKDYFAHLLRYLDPDVDPETTFLLIPWSWDEKRKPFPVIPIVTWFWGHTLLERFPVNLSGRTYVDSMTNSSLLIPPGWKISGCNYIFNDDMGEISSSLVAYPLPISTSHVPRTVAARYLFGRTTRGFLKSTGEDLDTERTPKRSTQLNTYLVDTKYQAMGVLNLNLAQLNSIPPKEQTEFELVVIAAGEITGRIEVEFEEESSRVHRISLPDGYGWDETHFDFPWGTMGSAHITGSEVKVFGLYYVLWIEWEDGVAYRKGLGRVFKEAWDNMDTEEIDLVLG